MKSICFATTAVTRSIEVAAAPVAAPAAAAGAARAAAAPLPIWRSSWRAIAAARPPGRPLILFAYWVSSISVPSCVPEFSSIPELIVASRMLFISCCMKSASNCFAVSRIAAFGSRAAAERSAAIDVASPVPDGDDRPDSDEMPLAALIR